jgi:hypothetical protein
MEIKILHIDDETDILQKAQAIVNGVSISTHTLRILDSCGFEEGMKRLEVTEYDLVILDLCVGQANTVSDKVGETVFMQIQKRVFIPVVFFTGLPEYVRPLESNIVRVVGKASGGYDGLFTEIQNIINSGFISLKNEMSSVVKEGVRAFFWNFVQPNQKMVTQLLSDDVSLKYLLLRRLGRTFALELTRNAVNEANFNKEKGHPMEYYIYPPVDGEYETGDIVKNKKSGEISIILTPSCDLVDRKKGGRKAEKILLVHTTLLSASVEFKSMIEMKNKQDDFIKEKKEISKADVGQLKNAADKVKDLMGPANERYFFLPPTPFLEPFLIDFQKKETINYEQLDADFECITSLDDPMSQAVIAKYMRYYSRVGYRDLDTDYVLSKLIG